VREPVLKSKERREAPSGDLLLILFSQVVRQVTHIVGH
jgi:hypothetical protein